MLDFTLLQAALLGRDSVLPASPLPSLAESSLVYRPLPTFCLNVLKTLDVPGHKVLTKDDFSKMGTCDRVVLILPHGNGAELTEIEPVYERAEFVGSKQDWPRGCLNRLRWC